MTAEARVERAPSEPSVGRIDALTVNGVANLPDLLVDRLQIELVLRNLISNAAEAIDPSSGVGAIRLSAERHDPQHVRIVVADNGPGIPAASWGLAVSRAIAEAHGGSLEAMPGPHGEFCLVLPAEAAQD